MSRPVIKAQPGPQTDFVRSSADIAFYGGAAGGGKSFGILLDPLNLALRYKNFGAVIFRRTSKQVFQEGGLWDTSEMLFPGVGGHSARQQMKWTFDATGSAIGFAHLEHEKNKNDWQGAQIPYIAFDELTHFSESQFWYMVSRNRSTCGAPALIRATLNPDPDHFAAEMVAWYIDPETGYAIRERSGVVRWFVRIGDDLVWANSWEELAEKYTKDFVRDNAKTFTFIVSNVEDNPILLANNPQYLANLMALTTVERERLRYGNWKVRATAGSYFKGDKMATVPDYPRGYRIIRYWDRAATVPNATNKNPDWTVGTQMMIDKHGLIYVTDVVRDRLTPNGVENLIVNTAGLDGDDVEIILEEDPGQAGKMEVGYLIKKLAGYSVKAVRKTEKTELLCRGISSQCEAGNLRLVQAPWNKTFVNECVNFPEGEKDDQVVTLVGGYNELINKKKKVRIGGMRKRQDQ